MQLVRINLQGHASMILDHASLRAYLRLIGALGCREPCGDHEDTDYSEHEKNRER